MKKYICSKTDEGHLRLERGFDEVAIVIPCEVGNGSYRISSEKLAPMGVSEDTIPERAIDGTPIIIG